MKIKEENLMLIACTMSTFSIYASCVTVEMEQECITNTQK